MVRDCKSSAMLLITKVSIALNKLTKYLREEISSELSVNPETLKQESSQSQLAK